MNLRDYQDRPETEIWWDGEWEDANWTDHGMPFSIDRLLDVGGIDLDEYNFADTSFSNIPDEWIGVFPLYRLTGATILLSMDISNYEHRKSWLSMDSTLRSKITL